MFTNVFVGSAVRQIARGMLVVWGEKNMENDRRWTTTENRFNYVRASKPIIFPNSPLFSKMKLRILYPNKSSRVAKITSSFIANYFRFYGGTTPLDATTINNASEFRKEGGIFYFARERGDRSK